MKDRLDPPKGVSASVVGLPVLAAEANDALSSPVRRALTLLAALLAVFLRAVRARAPLGPARAPRRPRGRRAAGPDRTRHGVVGGHPLRARPAPEPLEVDLNPMSITLGALVIAISTEFSVLLSARYRQEREAGAAPARAMELTYASTGAAVLASGVDRHRRVRRRSSPRTSRCSRLRHPHRGGPERLPPRGDDRAARGADLGRAAPEREDVGRGRAEPALRAHPARE